VSCIAMRRDGKPCRRTAVRESDRCAVHGGRMAAMHPVAPVPTTALDPPTPVTAPCIGDEPSGGFYASVLPPEERAAYLAALSLTGLRDELALSRTKLFSLLGKDPEELLLILKAIDMVVKVARAEGATGGKDTESHIQDIARKVLADDAPGREQGTDTPTTEQR